MTRQNLLVEILKHKGIGPNGSKTLSTENLSQVASLLNDKTCENTTKATLLTALLLLEQSPEEKELINYLRKHISEIPPELQFLLTENPTNERENTILKLIKRIDLDKDESNEAINTFFDEKCPSYLTAAFLEGERLKRETDIENIAFYNYYLDNTKRIKIIMIQ